MHIQLSHFFTFDPYVTFFVVAAVYLMVLSVNVRQPEVEPGHIAGGSEAPGRGHRRRGISFLLLAAICSGLAVGSKFAAILLFFPMLMTVYWVKRNQPERYVIFLVAVATLVFMISNPFAVLDATCKVITPSLRLGPLQVPAIDWKSCFLDNIGTQGAMVRGGIDLPFTRQYSGTVPYLYHVESQLRWGMGPLLGLAAFTGLLWAIWQTIQRLANRDYGSGIRQISRRLSPVASILLVWVIPFSLTTGGFYVKFMRYLQPVTPFLMLYGAALLSLIPSQRWRRALILLVLLPTAMYALSFVRMYQQPHPWTAASQWIYENVEPRRLILSEQWDVALPVSMVVKGEQKRRSQYKDAELTWLTQPDEQDDVAKLEANLSLLAAADHLTLASNRVYGVVPRLPHRYPISSQYYQLLFDGARGYEVVAVYGRFPDFFGWYLKPDTFGWPDLRPPVAVADYLADLPGVDGGRADESFTVYDQPLTIIFENVAGKTSEEMRRLFEIE
jgi:hypothetical protein